MNTTQNNSNLNKKDNKINSTNNQPTTKLGLFEEDDYFEEFDDEEWNDNQSKEDIDFKRWQEDWEDEDINDQFDKVLRKEMDDFNKRSIAK